MARVSFRYNNGDVKKKLYFDEDGISPTTNKHELSAVTLLFVLGGAILASRLIFNLIADDHNFGVQVLAFVKDVNYQRILCGAAVGIGITIFTWMITYLDSSVPGIHPPTPLSPRYSNRCTVDWNPFPLNYAISVAIGLVTFVYVIWRPPPDQHQIY